jgi:diguanylate cyclase (GGDEF)-like protein
MISHLYKLNNLFDSLFSLTLRDEFQENLADTLREYTGFSKLMLFGVPIIFGLNLTLIKASNYDWILYGQLGYAFLLSLFLHFKPTGLPLWLTILHLPLFILNLIIAELILFEKYLVHPSFMLPLFFFVSFYFHNLKFSFTLVTIAFGLLAYIFHIRDIEDPFVVWNLYFGSSILIGLAVYKIHSRILKTSQIDALTGLYNRGFSEKALSTQINLSHRLSIKLCLIYIDVDNFKSINDNHGHHQGDKVLCSIADSMQLISRNSDIVSRWGGDEFVIILPATDRKNAQTFIERLIKNLIDIEISCGLVELHKDENIDQFLTRADQSMYKVKNIKKQQSSVSPYS